MRNGAAAALVLARSAQNAASPRGQEPPRGVPPPMPALGDSPAPSASRPALRTVLCADPRRYIERQRTLPGAVVCCVPHTRLLSGAMDAAEWCEWLGTTVRAVLTKLERAGGCAVLCQHSVRARAADTWLDVSEVCRLAARGTGCEMRHHLIVAQRSPSDGAITSPQHAASAVAAVVAEAAAAVASSHAKRRSGNLDCCEVSKFVNVISFVRCGQGVEGSSNAAASITHVGCSSSEPVAPFAFAAALRLLEHEGHVQTVTVPWCGDGEVLAAANALGLLSTGIEANIHLAQAARERGTISPVTSALLRVPADMLAK